MRSSVNIYGGPHDSDKKQFLVDLVRVFNNNNLSMLVREDLNVIRKVHPSVHNYFADFTSVSSPFNFSHLWMSRIPLR
jgi:hypothetical protein